MLSALLKKQLQEIFRSYFYNAKQGKARSRASTVGYFAFFAVLMVGVLGGLFTYLAHSLCAPFAAAGMEWLYFTIMAMVAIVLGAFGSVFNTYSSLYLAKDNDLLLSMPIPVRTILLSRLLSVYLMGLLYSGVVLLPAMIVYWVTVSAAPAALAGGLLLFALVTIFVLTLSCALGWVVARISLKLKHRSITVVLTSLLFLSAYYFVYFKAQSFLSELVTNAAYYGAQIRGKAYPLYLIGRAGAGDGPAMAVVTAVVLVLFVLLFWLLSRSFLRIATASGSTVRRVYRLAFQFDFAIGILCALLAGLLAFLPQRVLPTLPVLLSVYVILDALLKLQIAMDARRFGMESWIAILCSSLLLGFGGLFALSALYSSFLTPSVAIGIALGLDGLQNAWITMHTVRVRARKKNLSEKFGLENHEEDPD